MPRGLKVFALATLPPGIRLKHPVLTAARSVEEAAKTLKVSTYYLSKQPMPTITNADKKRALASPGQRLIATAITIALLLLAGCASPQQDSVPQADVEEAWARSFLNATRVLEEPMVRAERNATAAVEAFHYARAGRAFGNATVRAEAGATWAQYNATPEYGDALQGAVEAYFWAARYYFEGAEHCYASQAAGSPPPPVCDDLGDRLTGREDAYQRMLDEYVLLVPRRPA